ncbi:IclR family transcriptional regulator [Roseomonas sp. E05]|uniref:IclR family transcriptional regulator n=1 Tax=Roseomonas sp. E05 TaxID=3046310 RepID=UPI0024BA4AF4|nr:IclR family transcriptional regulator [Roseomonas sp. E05]MDJ0390727.1 IclR family transcriptional regulator [Roseomonas sp. E05]
MANFRSPDEPQASTESGIQVLDRSVRLLNLLGEAGHGGMQLSRLAAGLGLSASTTHRLLAALEHHGWVERVDGGKLHRLGAALVALAGQAADGTGLRRLCRPALARLSGESGETTFLIVRSGLNAVVVDRQEGAYVIESLTQGVGGLMPLGIGAGSAAILASQPEAEIEAVLAANAARYPQFGSSAERVRQRLRQVQAQGYLMSDESLIAGLAVLSVAIRPPGHAVTAAIATNFIASRLDTAARLAFLRRIRQEVAAIEATMAVPGATQRPTRSGES